MTNVITYGTLTLSLAGHLRLLDRAERLADEGGPLIDVVSNRNISVKNEVGYVSHGFAAMRQLLPGALI